MQTSRFVLLASAALLCTNLAGAQSVQPPAQDASPNPATQEQQSSPAENSSTPPTGSLSSSSKSNKPKKKHSSNRSKHPGPRKVVIRNGSTGDSGGELTPGISEDEAARRKKATEQLLQTTDTNLKTISARQLTSDQAATVRSINSYMEQSRHATKEGDLERARNLAFKAHLLSDSLLHK